MNQEMSLVFSIDSIYNSFPEISYFILTVIIIYSGRLVDDFQLKEKRVKIAIKQRESYFQKLMEESLKMEEEKINEERQLVESISELKQETEELKTQLGDTLADDSDGWSSSATENVDDEEKINQLKDELQKWQKRAEKLQDVEKRIGELTNELRDVRVDKDNLEEEIKRIKVENKELEQQLEERSGNYGNNVTDPELLNFLEAHKDDLTLDFLEKAYDTLLELKVDNPDKDFGEYIKELKQRDSNDYVKELAELKVSQKETEKKYQLMMKRHEEELSSFIDTRVEHLFKNKWAKDYIKNLKEKNEINEEIIKRLKEELKSKRDELVWI